MTRAPAAMASVVNSKSADGRDGGYAPDTMSWTVKSTEISVCHPDGQTSTWPGRSVDPSTAACTETAVRRPRMSGSSLIRVGSAC